MTTKDGAIKHIKKRSRPSFGHAAVCENCIRIDKAKKQVDEMQPGTVYEIISHTNDFLKMLGMETISCPYVKMPMPYRFYAKNKDQHCLADKRDIVWMKFTCNGFLGVVAGSSDINFKYSNSSGKIINGVGEKWNEEFVLVFSLKNFPEGLDRKDIECGIGNYLICKGIPILDYYSHRYVVRRRK